MAANNLPAENPFLIPTLNNDQWGKALDQYLAWNQLRDITAWENGTFLFQIVTRNNEPYCRCVYKVDNRELYCDPADDHILRPFRPT